MTIKPPDKTDPPPALEVSPQESKDVVLVHGVTPDGEGLAVVRKRDDKLELGAVHPLKDGQPIHGEVIRLKPRKECPLVCDVEVELAANPSSEAALHASPSGNSSRKGPPRVTSDRYRENWDAIWKPLPKKRELSN